MDVKVENVCNSHTILFRKADFRHKYRFDMFMTPLVAGKCRATE